MGKRRRTSPQTLLRDVLLRRAGQRTVLGVALPVLDGMIAATEAGRSFDGVSATDIKRRFEQLGTEYLRSQFHTTYLVRPLGTRGFLDLKDGHYHFRPHLVESLSVGELIRLRDELLQSLQDAANRRRAEIERLDRACQMPLDRVEERRALVAEYLANFGGSLGETFEVISYAVLREYFAAFGFRLQRFSTTHANDGGVDYVGGDCIYQVSTDGGLDKLEGDLAKAPNIKRVVVRPELAEPARRRADEAAQARIEMTDLLTHFVGWLLTRDQTSNNARHLQGVLLTALAEFRREDLAERGGNR